VRVSEASRQRSLAGPLPAPQNDFFIFSQLFFLKIFFSASALDRVWQHGFASDCG